MSGVRMQALITFDLKTDNQTSAVDIIDSAMFEMFKRNKDQIEEIKVDWK